MGDTRLKDIKKYHTEGQFPEGSMGPKIEAAIQFLKAGGREVIITSQELIEYAIDGRAGIRIRP